MCGRLLGMVWETSPPLVLATTVLRLFRALLPAGHALGLQTHPGRRGGPHYAQEAAICSTSGSWWRWNWGWPSPSDVLGRANTLFDSLLGDRFTNRVSVRLMQHATELDLASFEDPVFYDKLERARRQTTGRLALLASLLGMCQDTLSLISLSAGLIVFSPWLMVLLVAAVIPAFLGETHFTTLAYSVLYRWTPDSAGSSITCVFWVPARRAPRRSRSSDWAAI